MKLAVSDEGVKTLQATASKLDEIVQQLKDKVTSAVSVTDEYSGKIGPHEQSLRNALESISQALNSAIDPVNGVSEKLKKLVVRYQEIIGDDPFAGISGN